MRGFFKFWGAALWRALHFSYLGIGVVSTLFPAAISLIQRHWLWLASFELTRWIAENQAEIQVGIAAAFLVPYLLYAPYKLYKEQGQKLAALGSRGSSQEIIEKLGEFLAEGEYFKSICHDQKLQIWPGDQVALWANNLESYLTSKLGPSYAVRVRTWSGLRSDMATNLAPGLTENHWRPIHVRCVRLNQFISELSSQPKSPISSSSDQHDR